jgi:hypothetical protein
MAVADVTPKLLDENKGQSLALDSLVTKTDKGLKETKLVKDETREGTGWLTKIFGLQKDEIDRQKGVVKGGDLTGIEDETSKGTSWLSKIFGLQEDEIARQKERDREADRKGRLGDKGTPPGGDAKKTSKLGAMLRLALKPLMMTFKAIGTLFSKLGKFVKVMGKFVKILLKPLLFTFAALSGSVAGVVALWAGLALIVGVFAGLTIASMTMSDKDFEKLKMDIANGIAGAIRNTVKFAMDIWNDYTPKSWNIDPKTQKSFEDATFANVSATVIAVIDFIKDLGSAFSEGFLTQMKSFSESWKDFKGVFDKISSMFTLKDVDVDVDVKGGIMAGAKVIGAAIGFIGEFFLDLATALGTTMVLKEKAKTDNVLINAVANILGSIIHFVKQLFEAFGKGFQAKFDKIGESLAGTKEAFGRLFDFAVKLWDKAKNILSGIGGGKDTGPSKSLLGAFTRFGELVGDMVASIFDVITILIDFMINPEEISGRARANVVNLFEDIGDAITDVFGSLFSAEAIMSMLKNVLPETMFKGLEYAFGSLESIAAESIRNKGTEIIALGEENKAIQSKVDIQKELLAEEKKKGDKASKEVLENLTYEIQINERRMERNKEGAAALEEDIKESKETVLKEKLNRLVTEEMGESAAAQLQAVKDLKDKISESGDLFKSSKWATGNLGAGSSIKLDDLEVFKEIIGGTNIKKLSDKQIMALEARGLAEGDIEDAMIKLEEKKLELAANQKKLQDAEAKLKTTEDIVKIKHAKTLGLDPETGKKIIIKTSKEGGLVGLSPFTENLTKALGLESGGLFTLSQGEFVLDNQAAQTFLQAAMLLKGQDLSGTKLMDLQRESSAAQQTGGGMVNIVNNSPQQVNQNQQLILPPPPISPFNSESPSTLN